MVERFWEVLIKYFFFKKKQRLSSDFGPYFFVDIQVLYAKARCFQFAQLVFLMLVLLVEYIFLTTFYGQSSTTHYNYNFFKFLLIALQPIVVTMIPWGHNAPAYSPAVRQALLRVPFQGVSLLHGLP